MNGRNTREDNLWCSRQLNKFEFEAASADFATVCECIVECRTNGFVDNVWQDVQRRSEKLPVCKQPQIVDIASQIKIRFSDDVSNRPLEWCETPSNFSGFQPHASDALEPYARRVLRGSAVS